MLYFTCVPPPLLQSYWWRGPYQPHDNFHPEISLIWYRQDVQLLPHHLWRALGSVIRKSNQSKGEQNRHIRFLVMSSNYQIKTKSIIAEIKPWLLQLGAYDGWCTSLHAGNVHATDASFFGVGLMMSSEPCSSKAPRLGWLHDKIIFSTPSAISSITL